jgi:hypothetical protein
MAEKDQLLSALLNKIDEILNGGDEHIHKSTDNYISWCMPGIPFQAEDLQFAVKGMNGKDAKETETLLRHAFEFSRVVNAIPSSNVIDRKAIYETNGKTLWDVYNNILQFSEVSSSDLTAAQKEKIKKFRKLFVTTKTVTDIITDEEKQVTEDGPMLKAYNEKKIAYEDAVLEYNTKRLAALNAENKLAVQDFTLNASIYRSRVKHAYQAWGTSGYREDVERINAYIKQISEKDLTFLKEELTERMRISKLTDINTSGEFYPSTFHPGNFVNNDKGWTKFTFHQNSKDTYAKDTAATTSASLDANFGLWSVSGDGSNTDITDLSKSNIEDFSIEFSITQVSISRPWFSPEFLMNKAWRWKDGNGMDELSDGGNPPNGQLIAYPTTAVFIKDIEIKSLDIGKFSNTLNNTLSAGGAVGWGPIKIGAQHDSSSSEKDVKFKVEKNTLKVEGMQLIALKCFALPKSPNPSPNIKQWV